MSNVQQRPLRDVQKSIYITDELNQQILRRTIKDSISENAVIVKALQCFFGEKMVDEMFQFMYSEHPDSMAVYPAYIEAPDKQRAEKKFRQEHPEAVIHEVY